MPQGILKLLSILELFRNNGGIIKHKTGIGRKILFTHPFMNDVTILDFSASPHVCLDTLMLPHMCICTNILEYVICQYGDEAK